MMDADDQRKDELLFTPGAYVAWQKRISAGVHKPAACPGGAEAISTSAPPSLEDKQRFRRRNKRA